MLLLETPRQIFFRIVEGKAYQVFLSVVLDPVRHILVGNLVRHHHRPVDLAHQRIEFIVLVTHGVQAAHEAADAAARDDVHRDAQFLHILDDSQMGQAPRASARKDEAYRGPVLPDGVQPGAASSKGDGVRFGIGTVDDLCVGAGRKQAGEQQDKESQLSH